MLFGVHACTAKNQQALSIATAAADELNVAAGGMVWLFKI